MYKLLPIFFLIGCNFKRSDEITRGHIVYVSTCIACHNPNPTLPGAYGPALAGVSRDLLTVRILSGGEVMPALPWLKNDINAIHTYLENL